MENDPSDSFTSVLTNLQSRIETLESQNARLEAQLRAQDQYCRFDSDEDAEQGKDSDDDAKSENDPPKSFEELLKFSPRREERLKKLEDGIEKEKEAAKKKKEEDAKKAKKWFEKYTIRGYAQFRINDVVRNDAMLLHILLETAPSGTTRAF